MGGCGVKKNITLYYKSLFGATQDNSIRLVKERGDDIPQVSEEENRVLMVDFVEEELKKVVFQMEHSKSPGFQLNFTKYLGSNKGRLDGSFS
jgi:hypothetical protein